MIEEQAVNSKKVISKIVFLNMMELPKYTYSKDLDLIFKDFEVKSTY
jgi:hypothetical protein